MVQYDFCSLSAFAGQRIVLRGSEQVPLSPKAVDLLLLLMENAGQVVSRETIHREIWGAAAIEEAVISRTVSLLRTGLRPYLGATEPIETISRRGYRFVVGVQRHATG